ncbi:MAG: efflux transporter outer membrane subunit [Nevskia sp.]|nr:efflux transporter outer membrane subunit [Nevskia sp.]
MEHIDSIGGFGHAAEAIPGRTAMAGALRGLSGRVCSAVLGSLARHYAFALTVISLLPGCAAVPHLSERAQIKEPGAYQSAASFAAPAADWPANGWWQRYGDTQLDGLVDEALRDSPTLAVAQARLAESQAMRQIAGAARKPQITADGGVMEGKLSNDFLTPRAFQPQGANDYSVASLDLSWELDFWGKNRAALAAATSEQKASAVEVEEARLLLSTSVAQAYAELAHLYARRDTAQGALEVRDQTVDLMRRRQRQELETLASVREAEAKQAGSQAELQAVDERIALQKNAIAALLGTGPDRGRAIERPSARVAGVFGLPPNLALDLIGRRPDIVAARLRTEAAAHHIDQHKAEFYPSVSLIGSAGFLSYGLDNLPKAASSFGGIGPAVSLPIFNTERLQGQLRGAHAEYNAAVASYNGTLVNALHEVADVVASRQALDGQLVSLQASVTAIEQSYRMIDSRYRGGLSTYLEVLSVEDTLLSARRELSDAQSRTLSLDVALVQALGGGFDASQTQTQ